MLKQRLITSLLVMGAVALSGVVGTVAIAQNDTEFEPFTQADFTVLTGNVQRPNGIAYFNDFLYTACSGDQTVYEINSQTGQTRTLIGGVGNAHMLHVESVNNAVTMFVPDFANNTFSRVSRGNVTVLAEDLRGPWGIAQEDEQNFLITNLLGDSLQRIDREGSVETVLETLSAPAGIAIDRERDAIYIANNGSTRRSIEWYAPDALTDDSRNSLVSGVQNATGLQLADDGYLYFAYALGTRGVVGRVNPDACMEAGGCTNDQVEIVVFTELQAPLAGLTITPDRRLFVHTMFNPDLYWLQLPQAG
jgi:DNA-binding beta-propeller fold protein YncE